ncbi:hypothetical protein [Nitriliruptor alkaliphilus]|uniref:hypothetical protein n=1 Tax=Nitriliruptor alkaliphilus TaxID=427918 RepID=UPI000696E456|nr:hypothetical protein [Nitriliruptor alkaliphilus]
MAEAHDDPRFANSATYAVTVTITVAGGARSRTAHRRASKVAERLANTAARAADVVDASAKLGLVVNDEVVWTDAVAFSAANTGHGTYAAPERLFRYLDPDHERALVSREQANARYRQHRDADRKRRQAVGCADANQLGWTDARPCSCIYCDPVLHLALALHGADEGSPRCLCGALRSLCRRHDGLVPVVLENDAAELHQLVELRSADAPEGER